MARNKSWFKMKKTDDISEIEILDEIDSFWGIGAKEFKAAFDEVKDSSKIKLYLNTPGGSVFEGMAIYNILASVRDRLEVEVIGLAASIGSVVALAGSKLTIAEGAYLMIHNPTTGIWGGADEMRKTADILDKMKQEFVKIYSNKNGLDEKEIIAMMDAETWMTSADAVEKGFADDSEDYGEVAAKLDGCHIAKSFAHIPAQMKAAGALKVNNPRELEILLRDAGGFSKHEAVALVAQGWKALDRGDPDPEQQGDPADTLEIAETPEQTRIRADALMAEAGI